tara:strand:- start:77252 stop:77452 length:201 start_codon:yes stop_codon:yes gene_type:complete
LKKNQEIFKVGDLVSFDTVYRLGIVVDIKPNDAFYPEEDIKDVRVLWTDNLEFWCAAFTLEKINLF